MSFIILTILFLSLLSNFSLTLAQGNNWSQLTVVSSQGDDEPVIDGLMDEGWTEQNSSLYEFDNGRDIILYAQHTVDYLYLFITTQYINTFAEETFSIYLSNSDDATEIFDKKQLTMFNASDSGNEFSEISDYYQNSTAEEFVPEDFVIDEYGVHFEGAAAFSNLTVDFRNYEFKIPLSPIGENESEDASLNLFSSYAIKVGYNSTGIIDESISKELIIQLGPIIDIDDDLIEGEWNFNEGLYILIVLITVSTIVVGYGGMVFSSKKKVGDVNVLEDK
jgi:hypothetical protein